MDFGSAKGWKNKKIEDEIRSWSLNGSRRNHQFSLGQSVGRSVSIFNPRVKNKKTKKRKKEFPLFGHHQFFPQLQVQGRVQGRLPLWPSLSSPSQPCSYSFLKNASSSAFQFFKSPLFPCRCSTFLIRGSQSMITFKPQHRLHITGLAVGRLMLKMLLMLMLMIGIVAVLVMWWSE